MAAKVTAGRTDESADRPLRILVLLPFAPRLDATDGGRRANVEFVAGLASRQQVAVLYARSRDDPPADAAIRGGVEHVYEAVRAPVATGPLQRWSIRLRNAIALARGRPRLAAEVQLPELRRRLREIVESWNPDVIQVEFEQMAQYLLDLAPGRAVRVITVHEPGASAARELVHTTRGVRRVLAALDLLAWTRYERRVLSHADAVVAFTERDRRAVAGRAGAARVEQIPLGISAPGRALHATGADDRGILFVGSYRHRPNVDAALRLARDIVPRVRRVHLDATLTLVGPEPPPELLAAARDGVSVTGMVPDVTPYVDAAALVAVPLRLGGGMRVKVLEALAAGKAVVCSPLAAAGLDVRHGTELLLAETDEQFAEAIAQLLGDPELRRGLGSRARAWASAAPGAAERAAAYEALYRSLTTTSRGTPPRRP
jgi:glycosyltransferase involved in cell wall biosynthesis